MNSHILLIDCEDHEGLIHKITGVLYRNNLNIISNGEFVEKETSHFFMRTEYSGESDEKAIENELRALLPQGARIKLNKKEKKNIVILATREHHCLGDLLLRHYSGELNANILAVISNHEVLRELTENFKIPYHYIPHKNISRQDHELEVTNTIHQYKPEFIILAKYMRILSTEFVEKYKNMTVNIHHSFLPAFIGANPYLQAFNRGVKIIGATGHFVTGDLDEGPIIAQSIATVDHTQGVEGMVQAGRDVEKIVLAKSLKLVFEERVFVSNNKTIIFD